MSSSADVQVAEVTSASADAEETEQVSVDEASFLKSNSFSKPLVMDAFDVSNKLIVKSECC